MVLPHHQFANEIQPQPFISIYITIIYMFYNFSLQKLVQSQTCSILLLLFQMHKLNVFSLSYTLKV